jgi:hypothetical protein
MDLDRIEYTKTDGGCPKLVRFECGERGQEEFAEQELGKSCWSSFTPSNNEREVARRILREASKENGVGDSIMKRSDLPFTGFGSFLAVTCLPFGSGRPLDEDT